ncbi:MAG: SulP family inorganic anion transporter [Cyanobacteriota bacterium]|nr:SulP family inorganic anion transporter [Cyanobacteriota bacterium]
MKVKVFNTINTSNLRGDIFGGLTAAVIALPMALAFGVGIAAAAGNPEGFSGAQAGLYGAVLVGLFAALFGGTPTLISEPTGPMTVVMATVVTSLVAAYPENPGLGLALSFTVVMMAGLFQIAFGLLRLGKYITLMPYTVISGFMSGIGIILIILQIPPFLGQKNPGGGVIGILQNIPNFLGNIQPIEVVLAGMTVAILYLTPKSVTKWVPPQLVALIVGTIIAALFFSGAGVRTIGTLGEIPSGLPQLRLPIFTFREFNMMFVDATILAMLGCIDALLTSVVADSLTRTQHDSDKELIGQGIGNVASGLFGGLPGAGATMGTVVNINSGAKTALSGLSRAVVLLLVVLFASGVTKAIPLAVLAGIALQVGIKIIDWSFLKRAHQISLKGAAIMYGVIGLTVFVDLITAVGVGVFVANVLTIENLSKLRAENVKTITDADDRIDLSPEENELLDRANNRILLFHLEGPMIFGVSKAIARQQTAMADHDVLIMDLSDVPHLGVTASLALENAIKDACDKGRHVFIVGAAGKIKRRLEKLGVLDLLPPQHLLMDRKEALNQALLLISDAAPADNPKKANDAVDFNEAVSPPETTTTVSPQDQSDRPVV